MFNLRLRLPTLSEEKEFFRAHESTTPDYPSFLHYYEDGMSLPAYLSRLEEVKQGKNLPDGHVPSTFLLAFVDDNIVGRISIRHRLNQFLERHGGHIGYLAISEYRRKGYGTQILKSGLKIAKSFGIQRVLVTCDNDNLGSIKVIERNGGVLENIEKKLASSNS